MRHLTLAAAALARLEKIRFEFGPAPARERRQLLARAWRARYSRAADLLRLHECLVVARAYPDSPAVLALAERLLRRFSKRADLRRLRGELDGSGIDGTDIRFSFFAPTALRLAGALARQARVRLGRMGRPGAARGTAAAAGGARGIARPGRARSRSAWLARAHEAEALGRRGVRHAAAGGAPARPVRVREARGRHGRAHGARGGPRRAVADTREMAAGETRLPARAAGPRAARPAR